MVLKNKIFLIIIFLFLSWWPQAIARIVLPELLAKQSLNNLRFINKDGNFTYYQKQSGHLLLSKNYKVIEILKSNPQTEYTVWGTSTKKKIIITQNINFHNFYSIRAKKTIYLANYGEGAVTEIGKGINPQLHLSDSWLSFYDPYTKIISFSNTINTFLKFSIKLNNRINPYFSPQVIMSDDNTIYYSDLNELGIPGILEFKRNTSKSELVYKAPSPMMKVEICLNQNQIILGTFGIHFSKIGSSIYKIILPTKDFSKKEAIYNSNLNDLGHLTCDFDKENIAFIKNFTTIESPSFDIANINLEDKKITPLSEEKTISNIINMDGILLTQTRGKYFIIKGNYDYKNVDSLKSKEEVKEDVKEEPKEEIKEEVKEEIQEDQNE